MTDLVVRDLEPSGACKDALLVTGAAWKGKFARSCATRSETRAAPRVDSVLRLLAASPVSALISKFLNSGAISLGVSSRT
jgi:hypothetical protein